VLDVSQDDSAEYRDACDGEAREIAAGVCAEDLERLGYAF
jgi:hypothetical protein